MMKNLKAGIALLLLSNFTLSAKSVVVLDGSDSTPVEGATVISDRGMILGITDVKGIIKVDPDKDFPLVIRSVGFQPTTIRQSSDTIKLQPATYELSEIQISPGEHPIQKLTCYVREYSSGATTSDTIQFYADYMVVGYSTEAKVKGFKKGDEVLFIRNERRAARFANSESLDSVSVPSPYGDASMLSFKKALVGIPKKLIEETEKIRNGDVSDTIMGKYGISEIYKKTDNLYTRTYDVLSEYKDHKWSPWFFKILGMTFETDKLQQSFAYKSNSERKYGLQDFIYSSGTLHGLGKGKILKRLLRQKDDMEIDSYAEIYLLNVEYLSLEEYLEDKKDAKDNIEIPFQEPKNLLPLPSSIQRFIDRAWNKR